MHSKTHPKVANALQPLLIAGLLLGGTHASWAQTPQIVVPPVGALSTLPQPPVIYSNGTPSQAEPNAAFAPALKYRDPTKALTLGEISDMQAQKANADILRKFGYTEIEPIRPKPVAVTQVKPVTSIKALAIWGKRDNLRAEILVNGVLHRVMGPEMVAPNLRVTRVRASGVDLEYDRLLAPSKAKLGKGSTPIKETVSQRVSVGQSLEVPL